MTRALRAEHQTPFQAPGDRHALCVQGQGPGEVTVFVAASDGHPFDSGPIALLDRLRVAELAAALTARIAESRAPVPAGQSRGSGSYGAGTCCGHHRERCLFGHVHGWTTPWMVDGRLMRDLATAYCDRCGSACTGEEVE